MSRVKLVVIGCLVALALTGLASASASALEWLEGKVAITKKEAISSTTKLGTNSLTWKTNGIQITCKKLTVNGGFIEAPTLNGASSLAFEECEVLKPAGQGCTVASTISTVALTSALEAGPVVAFKPTTGETFAELKLNGESCTVKGKYVVKTESATSKVIGSAFGEMPGTTCTSAGGTAAEEKLEHCLAFNSTALLVGTEAATLVANVGLKLNLR